MMNHAMMNIIVKITYTMYVCLACAVDINNIDKDRIRIIHLASKIPGYMIKKVYTWWPFIFQLMLYLLWTAQIQFMLYSLQVQCSLKLISKYC